ncbi:hypothetical protein M440DRAFT_1125295 [Trichoderma longibrachiatum ATCC 18648]|uniref:Uncharacterized protein n=1 Tax=Trichoderma longibrachiatum ATCC 18648 TaxID=983965 RepID=A0A2T4CFU7_TRILO|nr:hypothetical protein M440DRAFT_1125295 [Trichoderma longibrachiatum ATCC 18648]
MTRSIWRWQPHTTRCSVSNEYRARGLRNSCRLIFVTAAVFKNSSCSYLYPFPVLAIEGLLRIWYPCSVSVSGCLLLWQRKARISSSNYGAHSQVGTTRPGTRLMHARLTLPPETLMARYLCMLFLMFLDP